MKVRLRLNADPTTGFTVVDARAAVFNWLFRHHHHGQISLRLDDVNFRAPKKPRVEEREEGEEREEREKEEVEVKEAPVYKPCELLNWMGLEWDSGPEDPGDFGPLRVSERLHLYREFVDKLLESEEAYYCYFTPEEIKVMFIQQRIHGQNPRYEPGWAKVPPEEMKRRESANEWVFIRLKVPGHVVELNDIVRGKLVFNGPEHSDFVIMRKDGIPSRAFADVIDDQLMGITHVVRDESRKNENPHRAFIANALGLTLPDYVHLPVILAADRTLLSNRHGEVTVKGLKALGYMPDALVNYLCTHGWEPKESDQLRTIGSLARNFRVEEIDKSHSTWSHDDLDGFGRMAIERIKDPALVEMLVPFVKMEGHNLMARGQDWAEGFVAAVRPSLTCLSKVRDSVPTYFAKEIEPDKSATQKIRQDDGLKVLIALREALDGMKEVKRDNYRTLVDAARQAVKNRGKALVLTRVLLTGRESGSEFSKLLPLLGKDLIRARLSYMRRYVPKALKKK